MEILQQIRILVTSCLFIYFYFLDTSLTEGSVDASIMYEARVDIRKFSRFLQGQFNPTKIICSKLWWDGRMDGKVGGGVSGRVGGG